jgi:hypothetical protein
VSLGFTGRLEGRAGHQPCHASSLAGGSMNNHRAALPMLKMMRSAHCTAVLARYQRAACRSRRPGLGGFTMAFAKASVWRAVRINMACFSIVRSAAASVLVCSFCLRVRRTVCRTPWSPQRVYGKASVQSQTMRMVDGFEFTRMVQRYLAASRQWRTIPAARNGLGGKESHRIDHKGIPGIR